MCHQASVDCNVSRRILMKKSKTSSENLVAILPDELFQRLVSQLNDNLEEIKHFAGEYPDEDTQYVLDAGQKLLTQIKAKAVITPDPWEALAEAEMVLSDWETAKRKGYIANAKKLVFAVMDKYRLRENTVDKKVR